MLRELLTNRGYEVLEAANGEEGVQVAIAQQPSIILMDIQMPVMDGFEAVSTLRSRLTTADIVIIAVTAMEGAAREEFISAGFDEYIAKPFTINQLTETVNKYISEECFTGQP